MNIPANGYTELLIDELFKYLDINTLDLSNQVSLEKIGKIFARLKTQKCRKIAFDIISKLNEDQFRIVYSQLDNISASMLYKLPFVSPYVKEEKDLIKTFSALSKIISKRMLMSKYKHTFYRFSNLILKSKLPYNTLLKFSPLNKLKVLRVLAETKEYPLTEQIAKKDLEIELFPLVFEYKQGIQNFIEHWKW